MLSTEKVLRFSSPGDIAQVQSRFRTESRCKGVAMVLRWCMVQRGRSAEVHVNGLYTNSQCKWVMLLVVSEQISGHMVGQHHPYSVQMGGSLISLCR